MSGLLNTLQENLLKDCLELQFRIAHKEDISIIGEIEKKCFNRFDVFKPYQLYHFIRNPNGSIFTDVLLLDDRIIGWATYFTRKNSSIIRLYSLCIDPDYSGKGYAFQYMDMRMKSFRSYNAMVLEVRFSNSRAIRLYEKLGFRIYKKLVSYYPDGENGYRMIRKLA